MATRNDDIQNEEAERVVKDLMKGRFSRSWAKIGSFNESSTFDINGFQELKDESLITLSDVFATFFTEAIFVEETEQDLILSGKLPK